MDMIIYGKWKDNKARDLRTMSAIFGGLPGYDEGNK
jgi:hypothetical protein